MSQTEVKRLFDRMWMSQIRKVASLSAQALRPRPFQPATLCAAKGQPLSFGERCQTFEDDEGESLRFEFCVEVESGVGAPSYPLAVGRDHVFGVRGYPVEAITARHCVFRRGHVVDEERVVAVSTAEDLVLGRIVEGTVDEEVGTSSTNEAVGPLKPVDDVSASFAH